MRLSFLSVAIAIIFVLAIVHAPVEANALADSEASPMAEALAEAGIVSKIKEKLTAGMKKICAKPELLKDTCKAMGY